MLQALNSKIEKIEKNFTEERSSVDEFLSSAKSIKSFKNQDSKQFLQVNLPKFRGKKASSTKQGNKEDV